MVEYWERRRCRVLRWWEWVDYDESMVMVLFQYPAGCHQIPTIELHPFWFYVNENWGWNLGFWLFINLGWGICNCNLFPHIFIGITFNKISSSFVNITGSWECLFGSAFNLSPFWRSYKLFLECLFVLIYFLEKLIRSFFKRIFFFDFLEKLISW